MRRICSRIFSLVMSAAMLGSIGGCAKVDENRTEPLHGLAWFSALGDVKASLSPQEPTAERQSTETAVPQTMLDYTDVALYGTACDLTLCFTDAGLIGLNYHDAERQKDYRTWYSTLETIYGLPTEEGSGMASWYDAPLGKDTAVYLFNLQEGVQISFYASSDSPEKGHQKDNTIPAPELRTPVVPVDGTPAVIRLPDDPGEAGTEPSAAGEAVSQADAAAASVLEAPAKESSSAAGESAVPTDAATEETETAASSEETSTTEKPDLTGAFALNGLTFYGSPETESARMKAYTKTSEYRTEEAGQPWELVEEYSRVPYLDKYCDAMLCYTSLGLVGISYCDSHPEAYSTWAAKLTEIYGTPDEMQPDYSAWVGALGSGTAVYVFSLEDGVQISFFADDTGSELA